MIGAVTDELVDQITVGTVNLHAIKTRANGVGGGLTELLHHLFHFGGGQRVWHGHIDFAVGCVGHPLGLNGRRGHGLYATRQVWVGDAAHVPNLRNDFGACVMHGLGDGLPAIDLGV